MNAHRSRLLTAAVLTAVLPAVPTAVPVSAGTRAPAVAVSDCWPTDNGDPVLTGLTTAPAVVDVTDGRTKNLTFRATAQDTGGLGAPTGVRRVRVGYGREPSDVLRSANLHRDSTGSWSGSLPFYPGSGPTGPRTVTWVQVEDWAGNTREYRHAELAAMGMGFDFRFVAPTPDVHRPRLRSLAVSRVSVDLRTARRTITFTARLTDDVSGVTEAGVTIGGPWEHFVSLHRVRGTALDGIWRGRFTFTPWEPRGRRYIGIEAYDGRGRAIFLDPSVLDRRGLPFRLTVATRDEPDSPVLRLVSATPGAVDVRTSGAMVHVVVRATDATSGVTEIRAGLTAPEYAGSSPQVHLRRVAGTAQDGRWEGDIPLGRCTSPAGQWSLYVYATDRAQHWAPEVQGVFVDVAALDHVRPTAEIQGASTPDSPLTLRFSEDVTNLGGANTEVRGGPDGQPEQVVPGTWVCRTGAGTVVDCATDALRFATFTPGQPWQLGGTYHPDLQPPGSVGVRDLAGNPVDASQLGGVFVPKP